MQLTKFSACLFTSVTGLHCSLSINNDSRNEAMIAKNKKYGEPPSVPRGLVRGNSYYFQIQPLGRLIGGFG